MLKFGPWTSCFLWEIGRNSWIKRSLCLHNDNKNYWSHLKFTKDVKTILNTLNEASVNPPNHNSFLKICPQISFSKTSIWSDLFLQNGAWKWSKTHIDHCNKKQHPDFVFLFISQKKKTIWDPKYYLWGVKTVKRV